MQEKDTCSLSDRQTKHGCARYAKVTLRLLVTLAAAKTQAGPFRLAAIPDRENFTAKPFGLRATAHNQ